LPALRRLEYRGYDSAGIATVNGETLDVRKAVGKIVRLEALLEEDPPQGSVGVAHTRWATHGRPSDANAHPHVDCRSRLAIVHNGIIENYRELRKDLAREGHRFRSETDTEVIAHLIERHRANGLPEAVLRAARELRGAYALVCVAGDTPDMLVAVRRGSSPLIIGLGDGEVFLASDIPAILGETREILVLEEGEQALLTPDKVSLCTLNGAPVGRTVTTIPWEREAAEKGGYPHFMLKEIFEQPEAVRNTMRERVDLETGEIQIASSRSRYFVRVPLSPAGT
jgi:glucosamine--fructose-6-phosphate aminotransferase (isomerizing)